MASSISLKQIKYFIATAEHGQISQAAVALYISQSAVTTAIKELESQIGVKLFLRSQQGMELTSAGRQFLSHAHEILDKVHEATNLDSLESEFEGSLSVVVSYTVMGYFLPSHLRKLASAFPRLDINLFELSREAIEEGLLSEKYDIAVMLTANTLNSEISTETLFSSIRRLWVPARHHFLEKELINFEDISKEPYIMLTVDEAANTAHRYWNNTDYQPAVSLRTSSVEAVRSIVGNGQGISILSDMVHRPWSLEGKRIETMLPKETIPAMEIGLAWKKGIKFTPAMSSFRSYFRSAYSIPGNA